MSCPARDAVFIPRKPFSTARIQTGNEPTELLVMKQIVPVFLALVPLAAVVGCVVAVP